MTQDLDRDRLKDLLERLGAGDDADVLAAARDIDAMVRDSGHSWDELLAGAGEPAAGEEGDEAEAEAEAEEVAHDEEEAAGEEEPAAAVADDGGNAESLRLIDSLLAMDSISNDLRDELTGYKDDISEGVFEASDRRYVRALHGRLKKRR